MVWAVHPAEVSRLDNTQSQDVASDARAKRLGASYDAHLSALMKQHEAWVSSCILCMKVASGHKQARMTLYCHAAIKSFVHVYARRDQIG